MDYGTLRYNLCHHLRRRSGVRRGAGSGLVAVNITRLLSPVRTQARAELTGRLAKIVRIFNQADHSRRDEELRSVAIGYRPDASYNRREIVNGVVVRWYKVTRRVTK